MESKYDYVVFDIETTGLHPDSDQICEIAAIGVKDGLPQGTFSTLVAIEGAMPEAAGRVNGITDDMLKGAPAIGDALDAFLDFIGDDAVLAGHNIVSFDIPFVANAAAKSGASSSTPMSSTRWRRRGSCGPTCPDAPWTACAASSASSARMPTAHWRTAMTSLRS